VALTFGKKSAQNGKADWHYCKKKTRCLLKLRFEWLRLGAEAGWR
jgi:hypothetical protein